MDDNKNGKFYAHGEVAGGNAFSTLRRFETEQACRDFMENHIQSNKLPIVIWYEVKQESVQSS